MELNIQTASMVASTVVNEYLAVGVDGVATGSTGDYVYGIVRTAAASNGGSMEVVTDGEFYGTSAAAIAVEAPLTGAANGRLTTATIGTHKICAWALEAASGAGEVIRIKKV
jgi:hypothetical protein